MPPSRFMRSISKYSSEIRQNRNCHRHLELLSQNFSSGRLTARHTVGNLSQLFIFLASFKLAFRRRAEKYFNDAIHLGVEEEYTDLSGESIASDDSFDSSSSEVDLFRFLPATVRHRIYLNQYSTLPLLSFLLLFAAPAEFSSIKFNASSSDSNFL